MTAVHLACLVVAFLVIGPLETSAKDYLYRIKTKTGTIKGAGTDAAVYIALYGSHATCGWKHLNTPINDFEKGKTNYFTVKCPYLGCISKIRITHNNKRKYAPLYLEYVGVRRFSTSSTYQTFTIKTWIKTGSLDRTFSISKTPYRIRVYTGNDATESISISLRSSTRATYWTALTGPFSRNGIKTNYRYMTNMCSLKKIHVYVQTSGWRMKKIYVYDRATFTNYYCPCTNCYVGYHNYKLVTCYKV